MIPEQEERMVVAFERMADALSRQAAASEQAVSMTQPIMDRANQAMTDADLPTVLPPGRHKRDTL